MGHSQLLEDESEPLAVLDIQEHDVDIQRALSWFQEVKHLIERQSLYVSVIAFNVEMAFLVKVLRRHNEDPAPILLDSSQLSSGQGLRFHIKLLASEPEG